MKKTEPAKIMLAVAAGAATYKAVEVASALTRLGHDVNVIMTPDALHFVAPLSFAAVTGKPVQTTMFPDAPMSREELFPHLYPASAADLFVALPATADFMARLASGLADNAASGAALALGTDCVRIFCPSMNTNMWRQASVQANVSTLEARGWTRIGPQEGRLACGTRGPGRMAEPEEIVAAIKDALGRGRTLAGRRVLIFSGPTREYIDAVRYISNGSSGLMGRALSQAAAALGAQVDFVTGPVEDANIPHSPQIGIYPATSAAQMLEAGRKLFSRADIIVFAAAVSDYSPKTTGTGKLKKDPAGLKLALEPTADIAAALCAKKKPGQFAVGFALESADGKKNAAAKLKAKRLDAIVLNGPQSMGSAKAAFHYIPASGKTRDWGEIEKSLCASKILERAAAALKR